MIGHIYQLMDDLGQRGPLDKHLVIDKTFVKGNFYYILLNIRTSKFMGSDMQPHSRYTWIKIS